jgi:hypothetical protein
MNLKKILISLVVIAAVAAAVVSATTSFFSEAQTSTGNTFTTGGIGLKIDNIQHYNGNECKNVAAVDATPVYQWVGSAQDPVPGTPCTGTWIIKKLTGEKFFDFGNIMPGDSGENTVSLHVYDNSAWMCADITNVKNDDDAIGTDLERAVDSTRGAGNGELAQNMMFFAWADDGDNIFESGETAYTPSPVSGTELLNGNFKLAVADSTTGTPVVADQIKYIGLAWCAGTMTVTGSKISCNGTTVGNEAQTDSLTADITFRIEQSRNNAGFKCSGTVATPTPTPTPTSTTTPTPTSTPDITLPSLVTYTVSETSISPNGDGVKDTVSIDVEFSEPVKADINILDAGGTKVRDLYSTGSSFVTNPDPKIWDGKNNSATIVPNGTYTIQVIGTDHAGNVITNVDKTVDVIVP